MIGRNRLVRAVNAREEDKRRWMDRARKAETEAGNLASALEEWVLDHAKKYPGVHVCRLCEMSDRLLKDRRLARKALKKGPTE